jgi:3-dehydrosphinganine reductase
MRARPTTAPPARDPAANPLAPPVPLRTPSLPQTPPTHPTQPPPPSAAAKAELDALGLGGRVTIHVGDVSNDEAARAAVSGAAAAHGGVIDVVVTSAGVSQPRRFEDTPADEFTGVLATNVVGTRNAVFHALPHMTRAGGGRVVFISSQAGQVGLYGYTAYSASKFALTGLAQALAMELHTRGIKVSVVFPPDTDTPLLAEENKQKPAVTRLLSEASATVSADAVAGGAVAGLEAATPLVGVGFDGWMLSTLTAGMTPQPSVGMAVVDVLTAGLWRAVGLAYVAYFYAVIRRADKGAGATTAAAERKRK